MHLNPVHQSVKSASDIFALRSTPADIFLVFRTLLNCLKCIIYEDCYGWIYANRYNRNTEKDKEKRKIKWEKSKLQNVVELRD